jgi:hypothetical protein
MSISVPAVNAFSAASLGDAATPCTIISPTAP